jgi:membrane associated rhomboid family serine protease
MVFPLSDDNSDRRTAPVVNYVLIALNVFVFVVFQGMGANDKLIYRLATVPAEIKTGKDIVTEGRIVTDPVSGQKFSAPGLQPTPWSVYLTLLTSMFMHGGIAHLLGNMWFLWIFGDNVEDRTGRLGYMLLYLASGLAGSVGHVLFSPNSALPTVGASGAISGVMGAYLITFPRARILTLVPIVIFLTTIEIPAFLILLYWLLLQFLSGAASLGADAGQGGVAWFAHVGGFAAGIPLMLLLRRRR